MNKIFVFPHCANKMVLHTSGYIQIVKCISCYRLYDFVVSWLFITNSQQFSFLLRLKFIKPFSSLFLMYSESCSFPLLICKGINNCFLYPNVFLNISSAAGYPTIFLRTCIYLFHDLILALLFLPAPVWKAAWKHLNFEVQEVRQLNSFQKSYQNRTFQTFYEYEWLSFLKNPPLYLQSNFQYLLSNSECLLFVHQYLLFSRSFLPFF